MTASDARAHVEQQAADELAAVTQELGLYDRARVEQQASPPPAMVDALLEAQRDQPAPTAAGPRLAAVVTPTTYRVSCLPDTDDFDLWSIQVELRSHDRWSVRHNTKSLCVDGTWSYGPLQDEDATQWVKAHRFDLGEALQLAREHAPKVAVNGMTAADVLAREEVRRG